MTNRSMAACSKSWGPDFKCVFVCVCGWVCVYVCVRPISGLCYVIGWCAHLVCYFECVSEFRLLCYCLVCTLCVSVCVCVCACMCFWVKVVVVLFCWCVHFVRLVCVIASLCHCCVIAWCLCTLSSVSVCACENCMLSGSLSQYLNAGRLLKPSLSTPSPHHYSCLSEPPPALPQTILHALRYDC